MLGKPRMSRDSRTPGKFWACIGAEICV